jgi:hypothetical protein
MEGLQNKKTDDEIVELVADALSTLGFSATSQDTGGGICCVILQRKGGGEIIWELPTSPGAPQSQIVMARLHLPSKLNAQATAKTWRQLWRPSRAPQSTPAQHSDSPPEWELASPETLQKWMGL